MRSRRSGPRSSGKSSSHPRTNLRDHWTQGGPHFNLFTVLFASNGRSYPIPAITTLACLASWFQRSRGEGSGSTGSSIAETWRRRSQSFSRVHLDTSTWPGARSWAASCGAFVSESTTASKRETAMPLVCSSGPQGAEACVDVGSKHGRKHNDGG